MFYIHIFQIGGEMPQYRSTATRTSLTIRDLIKPDHGIYECQATNEIATIVTSTKLIVECKYYSWYILCLSCKVKTQYVHIKHNLDTSIRHPISGQSTPLVQGFMDISVIDTALRY